MNESCGNFFADVTPVYTTINICGNGIFMHNFSLGLSVNDLQAGNDVAFVIMIYFFLLLLLSQLQTSGSCVSSPDLFNKNAGPALECLRNSFPADGLTGAERRSEYLPF